jgi:chromosome segregation ATPase
MQSVEESKERLNVAARLHSALEQLQKSTKQKLLPSVDVEGIEQARHKPKSSRDDADILQLEQQLQGLADENTRLANRVEESSQVIENLWTKEAQVKGETTALVQELQRRKVEILQGLGIVKERVEVLEEAKEDCTPVIKDLKWKLQRLQEENTGLKSVFNESSQVTDSSSMVDECGKLKGEDLESMPEFEILRGESQSNRKEISTLGSKAASPKEVEVCKILEVMDECLKCKRQLNKLDKDRAHIITRMKCLPLSLVDAAGERAQLLNQLVSVLEDKQKREEQLIENLQKSQEGFHTVEAENKMLLSQIDELTIILRRLEEEKNSLAARFNEYSQALQDALGEKVWLADKVSKLEQEIQSSEGKFLTVSSELQATQDQLTASIKCEQLVVSELKQNKEQREEENLKLTSNLQELQVQLQALREENTHVVIKASKLDQLVEELKSDKLRLGSNLELLVRDGQRREQELRSDLGIWMEQVQRLEAEKLTSVTLVDNLNIQVGKLVEDNERLMGVSSETSQSLQSLWEENRQFIEELNKLEQEKQAQEGEKMELVAGLQEIWEQLQAANNREADIVSELKSLSERREFEEYAFIEKVKGLEQQLQDLEQQLKSVCDEKADISTRFVETTKVLEEFRQETSQKLSEMLEAKVLLENEVVQLMKMKHGLEEDNAREQTALYNQIQGLESEKAESLSTIEDLSGRVCASEDEINNHVEQIAKLKQFIQELHEENTRLGGEINKLEEVKERHEGERLELASELQAAWDQIQAVRESEANLATELSEVKELRAEEKVRFDGLLQELQLQLKEVMEQKIQSGMKVEELTKRLHELQKEQVLDHEYWLMLELQKVHKVTWS